MESANRDNTATTMVTGELLLLNTRQAGTRQPLLAPTTFIGREQGCDMRLNVDGIDKLHCLLINGHDGIRIRDLKSAGGTFVNGVRTEHLLLQNGDVLEVGPFQFRVELTEIAKTDADSARDALRIQVAAVAAQQMALEEEEIRLQKRIADREQQEEQLAAHLAAKQQQLEEWSERTRAEQEALQAEKIEHEKTVAAVNDDLALSKEQLARDHQKLTSERQRVNKMYTRLRQRWQKHWALEKEKHQLVLDKLEADRRTLQQKHDAFLEREAAFNQELMHFNTERELFTRQQNDGRGELKKDQERWHKRRSLEMSAMELRHRELDETQINLAHARQLLMQEKEAWDRQQSTLEKELHGINNRIVNQRFRLREQEEELARLEALRQEKLKSISPVTNDIEECDVEVISNEAETLRWDPRITELAQLASDLTDQRTAIVEQYERLAQIHQSWHEERARAARDLDALAERLVAEEQDLAARQSQTIAEEQSLRSRQAEVESVRQEIAICRAQMQSREQAMEAEHGQEMQALRAKEALLDEQLTNLSNIRDRWNTRRHEELSQWQASRAALSREQAETNAERSELFARRQQLADERCVLAEKSLALEQYWQEVSLRAKDPTAQERIDRLRRRWLTLNAAVIANARTENDAARKRLEKLEDCHSQLNVSLERLTKDEAMLAVKETLLDEREALLIARQIHADDELRKLEHRKNEPARQHLQMRSDAEAVAQVVFEETPPLDKAA